MYHQGLVTCYQPRPSARLVTLTTTLIIPDITKKTHPIIVYYQATYMTFTMGETEDDDSDGGHDDDDDDCDGYNIMLLIG